MTEKEKCHQGWLYNANHDRELLEERDKTKELLWRYNRLNPSEKAARRKLLDQLFGKLGEGAVIEQPFYCDYGYNITAGNNFFANFNVTILDDAKVTIGNNVFLAPNVSIYTAGHPLEPEPRNQGLEYAYPVTIGNNVWIGGGVIILPGVTIGDNVTIGAGSVVTKSIPPGVLALGNPCRVVREIPF